MAFAVKVIMDEVFGPSNYRNWITRKKSNRKNFTRKQYGNISDFILFYTKTDNYVWNRPFESWTDEWAAREYQYIEEGTGRQYKKVPVHAPGVRNGETGKPWRGKQPPQESTGSSRQGFLTSWTQRARSTGPRTGTPGERSTSTKARESQYKTSGSTAGTPITR
jgi:hypothetical protein